MQEIGDQLSKNKGVRRVIKKHQKGDCCCFCISTQTGVAIIGIGLCLGLVAEYTGPNYIRIALKLAGIIPWIMMVA